MKDKKTILGEIKDILFGADKGLKFLDAKSGDLILRVEADDFAEGMVVSLVTPDGLIPVEDGTYPLEDGRELYIVAGKIDKIEMPEEELEEETIDETADIEMAETTLMDGTKVKVEGDVAVGNKVLVEKDGEYVKAPEGQHNLADGKVIYVDADGLINEIETPETKKEDEVELEVVVEAPAYVDETAGMTSSVTQEMFGGLEKRMAELEDKIKEMEAVTKEMAKYTKSVEEKMESFVKDTPAELEFKSLKSEFNSKIVIEKKTQNDNLEAIRNLRAKNK
jgi:hypothetical protein